MEERKIRQIKGTLLKCAEENRNKPTPTFNICVSNLCTDAEQYIRELEDQIEKMKHELEEYKNKDKRKICNHKYFVNDIAHDNMAVVCYTLIDCENCAGYKEN